LGLGERYLIAKDVFDALALYEGRPSVVIFREDVMKRVATASSKLNFIELPVREEPLDGLPVDLHDAPRDLVMNQLKPKKKRNRREK
jgi:hypothetical protein